MSKTEIVEAVAKSRLVERTIRRFAKVDVLTADLCDLSQMVYLVLLEYDEDKIKELWERNEMNFFIVAIVRNNLVSSTSAYYRQIRKFQDTTSNIDDYVAAERRREENGGE